MKKTQNSPSIKQGLLILFSLGFFLIAVSVFAFGNDADPPPTPIDINQVKWGDADVSRWEETSKLSSVNIGEDAIYLNYDKANDWPGIDPNIGAEANATAWIFIHKEDGWHAATFDWLRPRQVQKDTSNIRCGGSDGTLHGLQGFAPIMGETYGFMVSGLARNEVRNVEERTNIVMRAWTDPTGTSSCTSETDPNTPPDTGAAPTTPDQPIGGVTALSGKNPGLAFNPSNELWLVVAESNNKIQGQLMTNRNKTSGAVLNIGGSDAHTPKVAYSIDLKKYLVIWTSGQDPNGVLWGQLLDNDAKNSGQAFRIASGGAHLYPAGNIQYDTTKKQFVFAYEKSGNAVDVMYAGVSGTGAVITPVKLDNVRLKGSAPSLAINTSTGEYCVSYSDGNKTVVQPISPSGSVGTPSDITTQSADTAGIIFNKSGNSYTVAWIDPDGNVLEKTILTCADDLDTDPNNMINGANIGVLVPGQNGFGLFVVKSTMTDDSFTLYSDSGNGASPQSLFSGAWKPTEGYWTALTQNTLTGTYGAVASPDTKTVKFVSNIGTTITNAPNNGAVEGATNLQVPSNGLPTDIGDLISKIYNWSLGLIGLIIFIRFFFAGFLWFTAAGNASNVTRAKGIMENAVYGTIILFSAFVILNSINPDLVGGKVNFPGLSGSSGTNNGAVEGEAPAGAPPVSTSSCNQKFPSVTSATGCIDTNTCTDVSDYTKTHDCKSNGGKCLLSPPAATRAQKLIASFNTLAAGKSCELKISSTIQVNGGPSVSACHKPGNSKSGTCADFNIIGNATSCAPYLYQAAKDTNGVVFLLDEYVPACTPSSATGGNIHVNF
ncbi:MAG: hypothetical protein KBC81_01455 [Candidatus Pacebacteria bacterium]|nr:hypothetical protein [Candidatus Paceibacterota bacterium]